VFEALGSELPYVSPISRYAVTMSADIPAEQIIQTQQLLPVDPEIEYDDDPDFHPVSPYRQTIADQIAAGDEVPSWMTEHAERDEQRARIICQHCHKRRSTTEWVGDGGSLAYVHGFAKRWCDVCALEAQLDYARQAAERIPDLEARLAKVRADEHSQTR
jgi:hypothetical protein